MIGRVNGPIPAAGGGHPTAPPTQPADANAINLRRKSQECERDGGKWTMKVEILQFAGDGATKVHGRIYALARNAEQNPDGTDNPSDNLWRATQPVNLDANPIQPFSIVEKHALFGMYHATRIVLAVAFELSNDHDPFLVRGTPDTTDVGLNEKLAVFTIPGCEAMPDFERFSRWTYPVSTSNGKHALYVSVRYDVSRSYP